jgi:hypothetical protein
MVVIDSILQFMLKILHRKYEKPVEFSSISIRSLMCSGLAKVPQNREITNQCVVLCFHNIDFMFL